jgi:hypothetical protein
VDSGLTPASDSRIIYVSSKGSDDANGLSPSTAVKTLAKGQSLLRNDSADQLLLKRGDTFRDTLGQWTKSGRSANEPILIGTYGTGDRPVLKTAATPASWSRAPRASSMSA